MENVSFSHIATTRWTAIPAGQVHSLIADNGTWTYVLDPGKTTHEIRLVAGGVWGGTTIAVNALQRAGDTHILAAAAAAEWRQAVDGYATSISFVVTNYAAVPIRVSIESFNAGERASA